MGLRDEAAVDFQTVGTGEECGCRLVVADLRMKRVAIGDWDVRRVGDYRIEGRAGWQCVEQIGFEETDAAGEAVARGVGDGYLECGGGDVDGGDLCMGKMVGERDGDGARTGADVENFERCFVIQFAEDGFDQVFRFGAGDEDGRCDAEREAVELLLAGNVLDGFAGEAAGDCGCVGSLFGGGEGAVGVGVEAAREMPAMWSRRRRASRWALSRRSSQASSCAVARVRASRSVWGLVVRGVLGVVSERNPHDQ